MGWRDQIFGIAFFRDAEFHVLATDGQFGRRAAMHEYPGRDEPWVEDLGRKARVIALEGLVIGKDYISARNRLVAALEEPGPGSLIHPTMGGLIVTLTDCRMTESTAEGGMARFSLVFVEAGSAAWPKPTASTPDKVAEKANVVLTASRSAFASGALVAGQPDFVAQSAGSLVLSLVDQIQASAGSRQSDSAGLAELRLQSESLASDPESAAYEPASLADSVSALVLQLTRSTATKPDDALAASQDLWRFGSLSVNTSGASATRLIELNNQVEIARLVRAIAIAEAARAAAGVAFDSYDAAVALREQFADVIDELLLATADDGVFDALRALRAAVVADITARGADLSRLVRYTPAGTVPAVVLAHQLYGDASRADEILARNPKIVHPLFVPGGVALEVLSDA